MEEMPLLNQGSEIEKEPTPEKKRERQPAKIVKPYKIMLYDGGEHEWIDCGSEGYEYTYCASAIKKRDKLNSQLRHNGFDHYGVLRMSAEGLRGTEIDCPAKSH